MTSRPAVALVADAEVPKSERPARERLATRAEVAEYLGVAPATLARWAHLGTGPTYRRLGGQARYRWADVEEWLASRPVGGGVA